MGAGDRVQLACKRVKHFAPFAGICVECVQLNERTQCWVWTCKALRLKFGATIAVAHAGLNHLLTAP